MKHLTLLFISMLVSYSMLSGAADKLTIAATPVPHAEILEFVKPQLAKEGIALRVKEFTDYIQPAKQTNEKQVDGNFFAHQPYLDEFKKTHKNDSQVSVARIHIEPLAAYSLKHKHIKDLPNGAKIAIPNDPSNSGRALLLLAHQGLIKLKDNYKISATRKDIIDNPKKLDIHELEAAMLPRILGQVDVALINTNFALTTKLSPIKDALFIEDQRSPYVNILVAREDNKNSANIKKLAIALTSPETKKFIQDRYKGAIIPVF